MNFFPRKDDRKANAIRRIYSSGLFILISLILGSGCRPAHQDQQLNVTPKPFATQWQDEMQFILVSIVTDVAEMARFANEGVIPANDSVPVSVQETTKSGSDAPVYNIQVKISKDAPPTHHTIAISKPVWEPELYENLVKALLENSHPNPRPPESEDPEGVNLLSDLTRPTAKMIERLNQQFSKLLQNDFTNPYWHEKAALILGAFALREHSKDFYDVRAALNRMTAHLGLARGLSPEPEYSMEGQVAEAILYTLMNNQTEALKRIDAFGEDPILQRWARSLRALNAYDYRELEKISDRSPLENRAWFVACSHSTDVDRAWELLGENVEEMIDYCRISNGEDYSVGLGHFLNQYSLPLEFQELDEVYQLANGEPLEDPNLIQTLNKEPERAFHYSDPGQADMRIISWGHWAFFIQRHLCHAMQHNFDFMQRKWGVPDVAKDTKEEWNERFDELILYPFVRRFNAVTKGEYRQAIDEGYQTVSRKPHLVSPQAWMYLCYGVRYADYYQPAGAPDVTIWHRHNPLPATACDSQARLEMIRMTEASDGLARMEKLYQRSPYGDAIADALIKEKYGKNATYEQCLPYYQPVLSYSQERNYTLARHATDRPDLYERHMLQAAALKPSRYFQLGEYFSNLDERKAVAYYERGVEECDDPVAVSNQCGWLVWYYFRNDRIEEAEQLADLAAETYSGRGLQLKGDLLYQQGKYEESLQYYKALNERYNSPGRLVSWYVDYQDRTGDRKYNKNIQQFMDTLFPRGIEKVGLDHFTEPPEEGVLIAEENDKIHNAELKKGDIIVALNGTRVYGFFQYQYVRSLIDGAKMDFIVWNGTEYVERRASLDDHRFGVAFQSYRNIR